MEFIKTDMPTTGADALERRLMGELAAGKKVLWLLSGGSAIASEVEIVNGLSQEKNASGLTVMLLDERYGPVGHPDSNWQQLLDAGADFTGMNAVPVMNEPLKSFQDTAADFARQLSEAIGHADIVIAVFGIGPDGHVAGILPDSPATRETAEDVVAYDAPPLKRITPTRKLLLKVDAGYSFVFGDAKAEALRRLKQDTEPFSSLPAKLLWELPEAYVYNDQVEGDA